MLLYIHQNHLFSLIVYGIASLCIICLRKRSGKNLWNALHPFFEAEIDENFDMLVKDKATLYISHRMSSCKSCHRIIVMENGVIEEEGTYEELLV